MNDLAHPHSEAETFAGGVPALLALARQCDADGNGEKAVMWLRRAAATGDCAAQAALGRHLLTLPPFAFDEGVGLIFAAAQAGHGEAAHLAAVLAALGAGTAQSWTAALDFLTRAAEAGEASAGADLALLAGAHAKPAASPRELRDGVDLASWLKPPPAIALKTAPRVGVIKNFLDAAVCDGLIARAAPRLTRATIYDGASASPRSDDSRTHSAMAFFALDSDLVVPMVRARIAASVGLPLAALEESSVLHYRPGQQFAPHFDFLDPSSPVHAAAIAAQGQRVMTMLIYLNEDYEGAETEFTTIGWRFKGSKGDALVFWNILPNGQPDPLTRHAGLAPASGEKFLFSQWLRCRLR